MAISIKINENCLVRHQACKRIFGGSRICFVACPNSQEIALELEIIKQKLREFNIEPYVAIDQREFQKDIFCEKICTKIIESLFCIVILNDVIDEKDKLRKPNANVYLIWFLNIFMRLPYASAKYKQFFSKLHYSDSNSTVSSRKISL